MELDNAMSVEDFDMDSNAGAQGLEDQASPQKKYQTRRKIEDLLEFKRMRGEQGWMDDFDLEFEEIY